MLRGFAFGPQRAACDAAPGDHRLGDPNARKEEIWTRPLTDTGDRNAAGRAFRIYDRDWLHSGRFLREVDELLRRLLSLRLERRLVSRKAADVTAAGTGLGP